MKLLVALCVMAVGVSAQFGESGIVNPDGTLRQFTREEADNIAEIGQSGVVYHDGSHRQFGMEFAALHNNLPAPEKPVEVPFGPYGYHGIIKPDGINVQFTPAQYAEIVLVGPSGAIMANGKNVQLNQDGLPLRKKRSVALEGPSGVQFADGQLRHLPVDVTVVSVGPSGAVLSNGDNVQFRKKRSASGAVVGPSGYITPEGVPVQLAAGESVVSDGPSGLVISTGKNVQYRLKRSPSGAVVGPSGYITPEGVPVQLAAGESVVSDGPSGLVLSTGKNVQYNRRKRAAPSKAVTGESGIITPGGRLIQLPHGVSVILEGPSAALLSNGDYVQYEF